MGMRVQLGQTGKVIGATVSSGLVTAATFDPEPISKAILAAVAGLLSFFKWGYDPKKLNDTAVTEALLIGFNQAWEQITDEHLPYACDPGQCGKQHQAIFTRSQWPNVPYPGGKPGLPIEQYIAAFEQAITEGRAKLQRPESVADFEANANYVRTLLQQVKQRQAEEAAASPFAALLPAGVSTSDIGKILPWALGGAALYFLF